MVILVFWGSLILILIGFASIYLEIRGRVGTRKAIGHIVGYSAGRLTSPSRQLFFPVVEFTDLAGRTRYVESLQGSTRPLKEMRGECIVYVRPSDYDYAYLKRDNEIMAGMLTALWGAGGLAVFLWSFTVDRLSLGGGVFFTLAIVYLFWRRQGNHPFPNSKERAERLRTLVTSFDNLTKINLLCDQKVLEGARQPVKSAFGVKVMIGAIATGSLAVSLFSFFENQRFFATSSRTSGQVISIVPKNTGYVPVIKFNVPDRSQAIQFSPYVVTDPPMYAKGDQVEVVYDPIDPRNARIDVGFLWNYSLPISAGLFGALMFSTLFVIAKRVR